MRTGLGLVLTVIALGVPPGLAQNVEQGKPRTMLTQKNIVVDPPVGDASSFDFAGVNVFDHVIPNIEGKSIVAVLVKYPPGGKSPAHHHARSAFIYAHVLSGAIRSQVDDEPAKVYQAGEGFYEMPGSHHRISENASDRDPASLLAVFIVDSKDKPLTTPDQK
jgi:quercetin dioxygenase-like cupin family protein